MANNARGNWTHVRLRLETVEALVRARDSMLIAHEQGQTCAEIDHRNTLPSLDWVVQQLLGKRAVHKKRRQKAEVTRREKAKATKTADHGADGMAE